MLLFSCIPHHIALSLSRTTEDIAANAMQDEGEVHVGHPDDFPLLISIPCHFLNPTIPVISWPTVHALILC
jgi:hypothetical protein